MPRKRRAGIAWRPSRVTLRGSTALYMEGRGVERNPAEAVRWPHLAAEQGYVVAQLDLGYLYGVGQGVPQDDAEALRWFRRAADPVHATSQANVAAMARAQYAGGRPGLRGRAAPARYAVPRRAPYAVSPCVAAAHFIDCYTT